MNGFLIAAPNSGSGKTAITLGLLRAYRDRDRQIVCAKAGPDYIDPAFHAAATGKASINLDPWAMREDMLLSLATGLAGRGELLIVEGMMGLFDGAGDGSGSAADLAGLLGMPVVLVVDASRMSYSVAALVEGFAKYRKHQTLAGVILNKVGSARHEKMLRDALEPVGIPVFGAVPNHKSLDMPSRHLGLVQARELDALETLVASAASHVAEHCDLDGLGNLQVSLSAPQGPVSFPPLGQRIAIADDKAFAFAYPHFLEIWRGQGVELSFFSPLANQAPCKDADAVFLPGGYPELHAGALSDAHVFLNGLREAAKTGKTLYGECGGYMVLGTALVDGQGVAYPMAGLLRLETSFEHRKLHLGYRTLSSDGFVLGKNLRGHEFHYTTALREEGVPLFKAGDAMGAELGSTGLRDGTVMGSYVHVIDQVRP